jgi:hypothetical protein
VSTAAHVSSPRGSLSNKALQLFRRRPSRRILCRNSSMHGDEWNEDSTADRASLARMFCRHVVASESKRARGGLQQTRGGEAAIGRSAPRSAPYSTASQMRESGRRHLLLPASQLGLSLTAWTLSPCPSCPFRQREQPGLTGEAEDSLATRQLPQPRPSRERGTVQQVHKMDSEVGVGGLRWATSGAILRKLEGDAQTLGHIVRHPMPCPDGTTRRMPIARALATRFLALSLPDTSQFELDYQIRPRPGVAAIVQKE